MTKAPQDDQFIKHLLSLKSPAELLNLIPSGLQMKQPIPIFTKLEDVAEYKKMFN